MKHVGFIGLGQMGWPMSANLARAGFELRVHDVDTELAENFAAEFGADVASEPNDFRDCDAIITMLPDGKIVQAALLEWQGGIGGSLRPGTLVVDMSSSNPSDTSDLAARLEQHGVSVVDAPVSGGVPRAIEGTLSIMPGGASSDVERATPIFDALGDPAARYPTGPLGTGHAMKALNNFVAATTYAATVEAMVVGQSVGLLPETMIGVINSSTGRSFTSDVVVRQNIVTGAYATGFRLGLLAKDVSIAADIAARSGVDAPVSVLTNARWAAAVADLDPTDDHSMAHQAWWVESLAARLET